MITIVDNQDRGRLSEGRNYQMGFAFLKRSRSVKNTFETVQPVSPCKDYLNDVVWAEHIGKQCAAHGLVYDRLNIFGRRYGYMTIKICPKFPNSPYHKYETDQENLRSNIRNVCLFINRMEALFGLQRKTSIRVTNTPDIYFVRMPIEWCRGTYLTSLYSLLLRISQWYKPDVDPIIYIDTFNYFNEDVYLINDVKEKIYKFIEKKTFPTQDLASLNAGYEVHNYGIKTFNIE